MNNPPNETERRMLLEKAARCYEKEGWVEEAGRVWEEIENYGAAARNYAQGENWEKAAQCYEKGEEIMKAAWIRADKLKQKYQSLEIMEKIEVKNPKEELEREIIRGRCQSTRKKRREVAKSVRKVIEYRPKAGEKHLYEWGQKLAQIIRRPDLRALLYGTAVREGIEGSIEEWEKWAKEELGEATGIPKKRRREEEYEYETVKVNRRGEIIERETRKARYYREKLREGIEIEMVYIEGGSFLMGSAEGEGSSDEKPQHEVTLEAFYLGK